MNKPRLEDYNFPKCENELDKYTSAYYDLNDYCNELEDENKNLRKAVEILMRQIDLYTKNSPLESYTHEEWLNKLMNIEIDENE